MWLVVDVPAQFNAASSSGQCAAQTADSGKDSLRTGQRSACDSLRDAGVDTARGTTSQAVSDQHVDQWLCDRETCRDAEYQTTK